MLPKKVKKLMDEQITKEIFSGHLYLQMSAWLDEQGLEGYANWFYVQYQEELDHAKIIFNYMQTVDERPVIAAIDAPDKTFKDVKTVLKQALEHEKLISEAINKIAEAVYAENDYKSRSIVEWFIDEQVEEEENARKNVDDYELFGSSPQGLHALDREMGARVYNKTQKLVDMEAE